MGRRKRRLPMHDRIVGHDNNDVLGIWFAVALVVLFGTLVYVLG